MANDRLIFYHVPKTGGSWARAVMGRGFGIGLARVPWAQPQTFGLRALHSLPDATAEEHKAGRFSFAFVRKPVEWYRSFWCYRVRCGGPDPRFYLGLLWHDDFETFVNGVMDKHPEGFLTSMFKLYVGEDGTKLDFVGRQENMKDDLIKALGLAGQPVNEKRLRKIKPMNAAAGLAEMEGRTTLSAATVARVESVERWIPETFYA